MSKLRKIKRIVGDWVCVLLTVKIQTYLGFYKNGEVIQDVQGEHPSGPNERTEIYETLPLQL